MRDVVRTGMRALAKSLNKASSGKISPNMVTLISLLAHLPVAYAIASGYYLLAAIGLVVFGLMDALDGELARLQGKASAAGMVLDASTDRMKEAMLYIGIGFAFVERDIPAENLAKAVALLVAAATGSIIVSYVKAKGETALSNSKLSANEKNRIFQDGLMRYEVRMFVLVIGLLSNNLIIAVTIIAVLSWYTAFKRLDLILRKLDV